MNVTLGREWVVAPLVSLVLLVGVRVEHRLFHLPHGDASSYHARVRVAADRLPYSTGDWVGAVFEPHRASVALLRPNVLLGRSFSNATTREHVTLMIVQCEDARDMRGHYPPKCYPHHGWTQVEEMQTEILSDGLAVPLTIYRFSKVSIYEYSEILVYNFFILPNGPIKRDHAGLLVAAEDPRTRRYGAAQVQVTFGPAMPEDRRNQVFRMLIAEARPVIDAIRGGEAR